MRKTLLWLFILCLLSVVAYAQSPTIGEKTAFMKLAELQIMLTQKANLTGDDSQKAHYFFAISEIDRFRKDPSSFTFIEHFNPPPGAAIGMYH